MKISALQKTYLYAVLAIILPIIIYGGVFNLLKSERREAEQIETAHALEANIQFFRAALTRALTNSLPDRNRLDAHFVHKDGVVDFINGLESMGTSTGVMSNISSLGESWQDAASNTDRGSLNLSLHVVGTFENVYNYLLLLEQVPQKLVLGDIQLTATESGAAPVSIKAMGPHTIIWAAEIRATVTHYVK